MCLVAFSFFAPITIYFGKHTHILLLCFCSLRVSASDTAINNGRFSVSSSGPMGPVKAQSHGLTVHPPLICLSLSVNNPLSHFLSISTHIPKTFSFRLKCVMKRRRLAFSVLIISLQSDFCRSVDINFCFLLQIRLRKAFLHHSSRS